MVDALKHVVRCFFRSGYPESVVDEPVAVRLNRKDFPFIKEIVRYPEISVNVFHVGRNCLSCKYSQGFWFSIINHHLTALFFLVRFVIRDFIVILPP